MKYLASLAILLVAFFYSPFSVMASDTLFENYVLQDDWANPAGVNWNAQPVVAASSHSVTSIKLWLFKNGNGGTMTIDIDADDGTGEPDLGNVLGTATFDCTGLSTDSVGTEQEVTGYTGVEWISGTTYHLVFHSADLSTCSVKGKDNSGVTPVNLWSSDSGATWTTAATPDQFYYKIYGIASAGAAVAPSVAGLVKSFWW